jgi:hypothetical protein
VPRITTTAADLFITNQSIDSAAWVPAPSETITSEKARGGTMNRNGKHQRNAMLLLGLSMLLSGCAEDPNTEGVADEDISGSSAVNTPPEVSLVEVLATTDEDADGDPTTAIFTDTLECVWNFDDAEGNADKSTVVWSAGGTVLAAGNIFEESTLSGNFFGGDTVTCTVTPDDGADAGTPVSGSIEIDVLEPPLISNLEVRALTDMDGDGDSSTAIESDDLECSYDFEDPHDEADQSYLLWFVNSIPVIGNPTGSMSGRFFAGDTVSCMVTAKNSLTSGNTEWASMVIDDSTPSGSAPSVSNVTISPNPAYTGDTLSCNYVFTDPDGDPDQSQVEWMVGGMTIGTGWTLSGVFGTGDTVTCEVTPFDGTYYGQPGADSIVISN